MMGSGQWAVGSRQSADRSPSARRGEREGVTEHLESAWLDGDGTSGSKRPSIRRCVQRDER
jgi:hypothetical protein